jgi:hypothetical protein
MHGQINSERGTFHVLYVLNLSINLLSITKCICHPNVTLDGTSKYMALNLNGEKSKFGKEIAHRSGILYAFDITPNHIYETAMVEIAYKRCH